MFSQNGMRQDEIRRERDKGILNPNSAHNRPGGADSEKNSKKIQKIREQLFGIIFSEIRDETGREREKRISDLNSTHTRSGGENSEKNSKKLKNNFPALCLAKTG